MPVSSEFSPALAAGSIATTMRRNTGAAIHRARPLDRIARPERAGHILEQLRVELLAAEPRALILLQDRGEKARREIVALSRVPPRVTTQSGDANSARISFTGFGVVVTTTRGCLPRRSPIISMSHAAG